MSYTRTAKENMGVSSTAFIRMDVETAYALNLRCLKLNVGKQKYVLTILRRSLGLSDEPDPNPGTTGVVPEVATEMEVGKDVPPVVAARIAEQLPDVRVTQEPEVPAEVPSSCVSLSEIVPELPEVKPSRGCQLPADFRAAEGVLLGYAREIGVFDPAGELDQFCDHHTARGTVFRDWAAGWRTWCRNSVRFQQRSAPNATSIHSEKMRVAGQIFGPRQERDLFGVVVEGRAKRLPG